MQRKCSVYRKYFISSIHMWCTTNHGDWQTRTQVYLSLSWWGCCSRCKLDQGEKRDFSEVLAMDVEGEQQVEQVNGLTPLMTDRNSVAKGLIKVRRVIDWLERGVDQGDESDREWREWPPPGRVNRGCGWLLRSHNVRCSAHRRPIAQTAVYKHHPQPQSKYWFWPLTTGVAAEKNTCLQAFCA